MCSPQALLSWSRLLVAAPIVLALGTPPSGSPRIEWSAPPSCPQPEDAIAAVEQNLGQSLDDMTQHSTYRVSITSQGAGWAAAIEVQSNEGVLTRALPQTASCAEATEAAALVVAMALTSEAEAQAAVEPQPEPEPDPEATDLLRVEPAPQPVVPSRPARAFGGAVGVFGGVRWGVVEAATADVGLHGALLSRRVRAFVEGSFTPPRLVESGAARVRFVQWSAAVGGCARVRLIQPVHLEPCGAFEAGQLLARPQNLEGASNSAQPWLAARAGVGVTWALVPRVAIAVRGEAFVPVFRPRFRVSGAQIARPSVVGARAVLGVEVRLGPAL